MQGAWFWWVLSYELWVSVYFFGLHRGNIYYIRKRAVGSSIEQVHKNSEQQPKRYSKPCAGTDTKRQSKYVVSEFIFMQARLICLFLKLRKSLLFASMGAVSFEYDFRVDSHNAKIDDNHFFIAFIKCGRLATDPKLLVCTT